MAKFVKQRAGIVERQQGWLAFSAFREIQNIDDDGTLTAAQIVLLAEARHPSARTLRRAREIIAIENANLSSGLVCHLPYAHFRIVARRIFQFFETQTKEPVCAIKGGFDHVVELQIGADFRFIEIETLLADFFGIVAPIPRRDFEIAAFVARLLRQGFGFLLGARHGFWPHSFEKFMNSCRVFRHGIFEAKLSEGFKAHQLGVFGTQSDRFCNQAPVVGFTTIGATRNPSLEGLLAQIAAAGIGEKPFNTGAG